MSLHDFTPFVPRRFRPRVGPLGYRVFVRSRRSRLRDLDVDDPVDVGRRLCCRRVPRVRSSSRLITACPLTGGFFLLRSFVFITCLSTFLLDVVPHTLLLLLNAVKPLLVSAIVNLCPNLYPLKLDNHAPFWVLFLHVISTCHYMNDFYIAYSQYLERMLDKSDDLVCVAEETIPEDANIAVFEEWAYAG